MPDSGCGPQLRRRDLPTGIAAVLGTSTVPTAPASHGGGADGAIVYGAGDSTVYAVGAATGNVVWAFSEPSDPVLSSQTVEDGVSYVGAGTFRSHRGTLYAVDTDTGGREWARGVAGSTASHGVKRRLSGATRPFVPIDPGASDIPPYNGRVRAARAAPGEENRTGQQIRAEAGCR